MLEKQILFYHAIKEKNYQYFHEVIDNDPDITRMRLGPQAQFPLVMAVAANDVAMVQYFLDANLNDDILWEAMLAAMQGGDLALCDILFQCPCFKAYLSGQHVSGISLMHYAAAFGRYDVLMKLKALGGDLNLQINTPGQRNHGKTPLRWAMENNQELCACELYQAGYRDIGAHDDTVQSFIHLAAQYGYLSLVQVYANHGGDLNAQDGNHQTPLLWAASAGQLALVNDLIFRGVLVDSPIEGELSYRYAPIFWAVMNGHAEVVARLLEANARI